MNNAAGIPMQAVAGTQAADPRNVGRVAGQAGNRVNTGLGAFSQAVQQRNPDAPPNRFEKSALRRSQFAFQGGTDEDFLRDVSGGRINFSRELKLSIRHEFFTLNQYIGGFFLGTSVGMLVATLIAIFLYGAEFDFGASINMLVGIFGICFSVSLWFATRFSKRPRKCISSGKNSRFVAPHRKNHECLSNSDCTTTTRVVSGLCRIPPHGWIVWFGRPFTMIAALLTGIVMLGISFAGDDPDPSMKEVVSMVILGASSGYTWAYIFS